MIERQAGKHKKQWGIEGNKANDPDANSKQDLGSTANCNNRGSSSYIA